MPSNEVPGDAGYKVSDFEKGKADMGEEETIEKLNRMILVHGDCRIACVTSGIISEDYTDPRDLAHQILALTNAQKEKAVEKGRKEILKEFDIWLGKQLDDNAPTSCRICLNNIVSEFLKGKAQQEE